MSDEAIVKRLNHAKTVAKEKCRKLGYNIINSDNEIFCFIASIAGIYERKIRVTIDEIKERDIELIKNSQILSSQTKEIWCRIYGSRDWEIIRFDHNNNICQ